jgi:SNF2 family DNA or RNA helicase
MPFLICVPKGLLDQWNGEIVAHTTLGRFGEIIQYADMNRHSLYPNYDSIASASIILTTRHTILSDLKQVYSKAEGQFSSALFPALSKFDAACVLVSSKGRLHKDITEKYPELVNPSHSAYRSFWHSSWSRSSDQYSKRFAAFVVDEAHQLRNHSVSITHAVYALSKSTTLRFLLTGTPFNNSIGDIATLSWLLQDRNAWQELEWWTARRDLEKISVQNDLAVWRESVLIRGKERISQELPLRNQEIIGVEATAAEKKFSATLFIKFQEAIMRHDEAVQHEENRNRFLAWKCIYTTLLRMMQMTFHRLIVCKNSRNFTHRYSRLSRYKFRPFCVNCVQSDDVPVSIKANRAREIHDLEDWIQNNEDGSSDDDSYEHGRSRRAAVSRFSELPCRHTVCTSCMQEFLADPIASPCQFCADMCEIGMEDCANLENPPPSSKLTALIEHLKMLPQYRSREHDQESLKQETPNQEFTKPEQIEKAVVFTLFKASLDICEAALRDAGISHIRIDGETPNRTEVIARFMHDESIHVLLASSRAAGLGLNLTRASTVIESFCVYFCYCVCIYMSTTCLGHFFGSMVESSFRGPGQALLPS